MWITDCFADIETSRRVDDDGTLEGACLRRSSASSLGDRRSEETSDWFKVSADPLSMMIHFMITWHHQVDIQGGPVSVGLKDNGGTMQVEYIDFGQQVYDAIDYVLKNKEVDESGTGSNHAATNRADAEDTTSQGYLSRQARSDIVVGLCGFLAYGKPLTIDEGKSIVARIYSGGVLKGPSEEKIAGLVHGFLTYRIEGKMKGLKQTHIIVELCERVSKIDHDNSSIVNMLRKRTKAMQNWNQQDRQEHNRRRAEPAGPEVIADAKLKLAPWRQKDSRG